MTIIDKLQKASFRGAEFIFSTTSTSGGRKTVTHEYPNSNKRVVEDLGKLEKTFTITAYIYNKVDDYFAKRDALIDALDADGSGILIHPYYGSVLVSAKPYTINESFNELGVATFSMEFERTDKSVYPVETAQLISSDKTAIIAGGISDIQDLSIIDITENFSVSSSANFFDAEDKIESIASGFTDAIADIFDDSTSLNDFSALVVDFSEKTVTYINNPDELADDLINIFEDSLTAISDPLLRFNTFKQFFTFGDDDIAFSSVTDETEERLDNRQVLNNNVQLNALLVSYDAALNIDYKTVDELQEVNSLLSAEFNKINNNDEITPEARALLNDINNNFTVFSQQQSVSLPRISTVKVNTIPMTILSYKFYGNLENVEILIDLNEEVNPSFVAGEVKVLSNV